jgi:hypothetical protein
MTNFTRKYGHFKCLGKKTAYASGKLPLMPEVTSSIIPAAFRGEWWKGLDSNQCTLTRADLQSAAFNHSATLPRGRFEKRGRPMPQAIGHVNAGRVSTFAAVRR